MIASQNTPGNAALRRILADNDPRNGSVATRIIRALEDRDNTRTPDEDGLYPDAKEWAESHV